MTILETYKHHHVFSHLHKSRAFKQETVILTSHLTTNAWNIISIATSVHTVTHKPNRIQIYQPAHLYLITNQNSDLPSME